MKYKIVSFGDSYAAKVCGLRFWGDPWLDGKCPEEFQWTRDSIMKHCLVDSIEKAEALCKKHANRLRTVATRSYP